MPGGLPISTLFTLQSISNGVASIAAQQSSTLVGTAGASSMLSGNLNSSSTGVLITEGNASALLQNLSKKEPIDINAPERNYKLVSLFEKQTCQIYIREEDKSVTNTKLNFFTTSAQENSQEKMQIVENFNDFNVYFFGQKPMLWSFGGIMRNDHYNNWSNIFDVKYHAELRGTQAAKKRRKIIFAYDNVIIEGYIVQMGKNKSAGSDRAASFSFMFLVTDFKPLFFSSGNAAVTDLQISNTGTIDQITSLSTAILVDGETTEYQIVTAQQAQAAAATAGVAAGLAGIGIPL